MTVGVDLRFEVRFGKWTGVPSLSATAGFRFDDLVEVVTVDDGAGGTHFEAAFSSSAGNVSTALAINAVDERLADLEVFAFSFLACLETPRVGVLLREVESNRRSAFDGPLSSLFILKPVLLADGGAGRFSVESCESTVMLAFPASSASISLSSCRCCCSAAATAGASSEGIVNSASPASSIEFTPCSGFSTGRGSTEASAISSTVVGFESTTRAPEH
jgi:hypothetical protein